MILSSGTDRLKCRGSIGVLFSEVSSPGDAEYVLDAFGLEAFTNRSEAFMVLSDDSVCEHRFGDPDEASSSYAARTLETLVW